MMITKRKTDYIKLLYDEGTGNVLLLTDVIADEIAEFRYNDYGQVIEQIVTKQGKVSTRKEYEYDAYGQLISEKDISGTTEKKTEYTYDNAGTGRIKTVSSGGQHTEYEYDSFGRETKVTERFNDKKQETVKTYDKNGNIVKEVWSTGVTEEYIYDELNRVRIHKVTSKANTSVTYTDYEYTDVTVRTSDMYKNTAIYNTQTYKNVLCITTKDENHNIISKTYSDEIGHVVREYANGVYTDYQYDNQGNVVSSFTYAEGEHEAIRKAYSYDKYGNLTATLINPDIYSDKIKVTNATIVTKSAYDETGNVTSETDALGNEVTYKYSKDKKLAEIWLPGDTKASHKYDYSVPTGTSYFADKTTDAKGSVSETVSNAAGQVMYVQDKGYDGTSIKTSYEYDSRGNVIKETNGNGTIHTMMQTSVSGNRHMTVVIY